MQLTFMKKEGIKFLSHKFSSIQKQNQSRLNRENEIRKDF